MTAFNLKKDLQIYDTTTQLFSSRIFFQKEYGRGTNVINIENEYIVEIINYLNECAQLIRFTETITKLPKNTGIVKEGAVDRANGLTLRGWGEYEDEEKYKSVYFYKDNLIYLHKVESGNLSVSFEFPAGYPDVIKEFDDFLVKQEPKHQVSILMKEYGDITIQSVPLDFSSNFNLEKNYGQEFANITNEKIIKKLNNKGSGLFIFNGPPGGGKTFYIKYLTKEVDREFIFIPSNLIEALNGPDFITLLMRHKNSVLVLEDAEHALKSRDSNPNAVLVSVLLNLSEGLLSSVLNISVIVTHNSNEELIDKALTRPGRLMFRHEFGPLSVEDAQILINHLEIEYKCESPMTLGEIYNVLDDMGKAPKKQEHARIGF